MSFNALQEAVYVLLANDEGLTDVVAEMRDLQGNVVTDENEEPLPAVYDHVPQPADGGDDDWFPYVTIGETQFNEWDTDDSKGFECDATVHCWVRELGRTQTRKVQEVIYGALHRHDLEVEGHNVITVDQQFCEAVVDTDGKTRHGIQRFRIVFENVNQED